MFPLFGWKMNKIKLEIRPDWLSVIPGFLGLFFWCGFTVGNLTGFRDGCIGFPFGIWTLLAFSLSPFAIVVCGIAVLILRRTIHKWACVSAGFLLGVSPLILIFF